MLYGIYCLIGVAGISVVIWVSRTKLRSYWTPSYQDLLDEKARLSACVTHWKYADGSLVPQHKRQVLFKDLHRVSRKIRNHPDNPSNMQAQSDSIAR